MKKLFVLFLLPLFFFSGCNLGEGEEVSQITIEDEVANQSTLALLSIHPEDNATGVWIDNKILFTFNADIDGANSQMCDIRDSSNNLITEWTYEYVGTDGIAIKPTARWGSGETYSLTCGYGIKDVNGYSLTNTFTTHFSTTKVTSTFSMTGLSNTAGFGSAIALSNSGNRAIISSPTDGALGSVRYFDFNGTIWNETRTIYGPASISPSGGGNLGTSVAINAAGTFALAGAPAYDFGTSDTDNSGIYLYIEEAGETQYDGQTNNLFGSAVAISDDGITRVSIQNGIVEDPVPQFYFGGIHINFYDTFYNTISQFIIYGPTIAEDHINPVVAVSGNGESVVAQFNAAGFGEVRTYNHTINAGNIDSWEETTGRIINPTSNTRGDFGNALDLSDDGLTLLVGFRDGYHGVDSAFITGDAVIYMRAGLTSNWNVAVRLSQFIPNDISNFGYSVSINGNATSILVGSPYEDITINGTLFTAAGAVYHFTNVNGIWSLAQKYVSANPADGASFGIEVDQSDDGKTMLISNGIGIYGDAYILQN